MVMYLNSISGFAPNFWCPLLVNKWKGGGLVTVAPLRSFPVSRREVTTWKQWQCRIFSTPSLICSVQLPTSFILCDAFWYVRGRFHFNFKVTQRCYSVSGSYIKEHPCLYFQCGNKGNQLNYTFWFWRYFFVLPNHPCKSCPHLLSYFNYFCHGLVLFYFPLSFNLISIFIMG